MKPLFARLSPVLWCVPATAWAAAAGADTWAQLGFGLGDGVRRVGVAVGQWLWHPLSTVDGIALALSDRRHGLDAWVSATAHTWAGLTADPAGAAGVALGLAVCATACVGLASGLGWLGEPLWQRLAAAWAPPTRRRGRAARLWRAWRMRQEWRRGQAGGAWPVWQRLLWALADVLETPRLLRRYGMAGLDFMLGRAWRTAGRLLSRLMREVALQVAYLALPLALLAAPWIELSVQGAAMQRLAMQRIVPLAQAMVAGAAAAPADVLAAQAGELRAALAAHRRALLAPVAVLDARLDAGLSALDAQLGDDALAARVVDHRLDGLFDRFAAYRLRWLALRVLPPAPDAMADVSAAPRTWFESRAFERRALSLARDRAAAPGSRARLDRLLAALEAETAYEWCLRGWDASELLKSPLPAVAQCGRSP